MSQLIDQEFVDEDIYVDEAENGTRFLNFLIDRVIIWLLNYALLLLFVIFVGIISNLLYYLIFLLVFFLYYTLMEYSTKGKTIGKYITGTKAVYETGKDLTFQQAFLRTLCRLIPLNGISFLVTDRGWHDRISKTYVIKSRK